MSDRRRYLSDMRRTSSNRSFEMDTTPMESQQTALEEEISPHVSRKNLTPRQYQLDVVERVRRGNTIACLPTGSGKTFIAILVMKERAPEVQGSFRDGAKRTVFLVPSVALVSQQADEIEQLTYFKVKGYVGADGVDGWSADDWLKEFEDYQVLVMTAQIMVNILSSGYLRNRRHKGLSCVDLLVLDECHHAAKSHPYAQVMSRMEDLAEDADRPRIFGLSASLVNESKKSVDAFDQLIEKLKATTYAELTTARDMVDVRKYATKPDIELVGYETQSISNDLTAVLDGLVDFLGRYPAPKLFSEVLKSLKNGIITLRLIYIELGPWAARRASRFMAADLQRACNPFRDPLGIFRLCLSRLRIVNAIAKRLSYRGSGSRKRLVIHSKLLQLQEVLEVHIAKMASLPEPKPLMAIVFVDRRYMALALNQMLRQMGQVDPHFGEVVRSNYLTGHGDMDIMSKEAAMKVKVQTKIIKEFSNNTINVLVATRVAEEGLDIRKCNLVVRFDILAEFRGYVQSRGRARDKPSSFIVMTPECDRAKLSQRLERFAMFEEHLVTLCQDEHQEFLLNLEDDDDDDDDENIIFANRVCTPFYPDPTCPELARADLSNAIQIVNGYVSKLCKDGTQLAPKTEFHESFSEHYPNDECFKCVLELPTCSAIPRTKITGMAMKGRKLAKRAVCLKTVKLLFGKGELNGHLRPLPLDEGHGDGDDFSDDDDDGADGARVSKRSAKSGRGQLNNQHYYQMQVPDCFQMPVKQPVHHRHRQGNPRSVAGASSSSSPGVASSHCFQLYALRVTADSSEAAEKYSGAMYGILVPQPLAGDTKFNLTHAPSLQLHVHVALRKQNVRLSADEERLVSDFTSFLFKLGIDVPSHKCRLHRHLEFVRLLSTDSTPCRRPFWHAGLVMMASSATGSEDIDWPTMQHIHSRSNGFRSQWSPAVVRGEVRASAGRIVEKDWESLPAVSPSERGKLQVAGLCRQESASSVAPPSGDVTFDQRDQDKGYKPVRHPELPLLEVRRADAHWDFVRNNVQQGQKSSKRQRDLKVFKVIAGNCKLHALTSSQFHAGSVLPSLLIRLFHEQQARELHLAICSSMALQAKDKLPPGIQLQIQQSRGSDSRYGSMLGNRDFSGLAVAYPSAELVFESLARPGCLYEVNLERLEMLGDSFLKLATSIYLFCRPDFQLASEGLMSHYRQVMISNATLCKVSRRRGIVRYMPKICAQIKDQFLPPLCRVCDAPIPTTASPPTAKRSAPSQDAFLAETVTRNELKVKNVADTIEALIAAFLLSAGNDAARHFMLWCGVPYRSASKKKKRAKTGEGDGSGEGRGASLSSPVSLSTHAGTTSSTVLQESMEEETSDIIVAMSRSVLSGPQQTRAVAAARRPPQIPASGQIALAPSFSRSIQRGEAQSMSEPGQHTDVTNSSARVTSTSRLDRPMPRSGARLCTAAAGAGRQSRVLKADASSAQRLRPATSLDKHAHINDWFLRPTLPKCPQKQFEEHQSVSDNALIPCVLSLRKQYPVVAIVEQTIGYEFREPSWLLEAITHPSHNRFGNDPVRSYQQLEFVGDAILDYLVVRHVYDNHETSLGPGDLALILHSVTCNSKLAEIAVSCGLHQCLRYGSVALSRDIKAYVRALKKLCGESSVCGASGISSENFLNGDHEDEGQGLEWLGLDKDSDDEDDDSDGRSHAQRGAGGESEEEDDDEDADTEREVQAPKVLGDLLESITAAVFADCCMNLDKTWKVLKPIILETIETAVQQAKDGVLKSPVVQVHELAGYDVSFSWEARGRRTLGVYTVVTKSNEERRTFVAFGESSYSAKIAAAKAVLSALKPQPM